MKDEIVDLFQNISLPFDNGNGEKEQAILNYCSENELNATYHDKIGIIVEPEDEVKIVVVSHIDLIPKFNKGFKNEKKSFIKDDFLIGALDNTITNAVALLLAKEKLSGVRFVFTEGEEIGLLGMKKYIKKYGSKDHFYVNLDVTNEGWEHGVSVEYDYPSYELCKKILKSHKKKDLYFTNYRVCDDLDIIVQNKLSGFSLCLPTDGVIHSWKNKTKISYLPVYFNTLKNIIDLLCQTNNDVLFCSDCQKIYDLDSLIKDYKSIEEYKKDNKQNNRWNLDFSDHYNIFDTPDEDSSNQLENDSRSFFELTSQELRGAIDSFCDESGLTSNYSEQIFNHMKILIKEKPYTDEMEMAEIFFYLGFEDLFDSFMSMLIDSEFLIISSTQDYKLKLLWTIKP